MELVRGRVVRSLAGRDKGIFLAVLEHTDGYVLVADGGLRKTGSPKKKKERHVAGTHTVLPEASLQNDKQLQKALEEAGFGRLGGREDREGGQLFG